MDKIVALCKRRGFIFQSSEIYGGLNGAWDYGPLGVELKRNVKDAWWKAMVRDREDVVGLDGAILMHPMVWKASGHVSNFADPMVDCKKCKKRYRVDTVKYLARHTTVVDDKKSGVITLTFSDTDPRRAQAIAQAYLEELNSIVTRANTSSARREREFIEKRLVNVQAELQAAEAVPAEALAIQMRSLIDLPNHGATFYTWLIIRSLLAPLAELGEDELLAVLAGALKASPLKLDRSSRNIVNGAR